MHIKEIKKGDVLFEVYAGLANELVALEDAHWEKESEDAAAGWHCKVTKIHSFKGFEPLACEERDHELFCCDAYSYLGPELHSAEEWRAAESLYKQSR